MDIWLVDTIITILLLAGIVVGYKKGLLQQLISLSGFIIAYIIAVVFYNELAPYLKGVIPFIQEDKNIIFTVLPMDLIEGYYYKAISFAILLFGTKISLRLVSNILDLLTRLPAIRQINGSGGAILGFIESYLIVMILVSLIGFIPFSSTKPVIEGSKIANVMIKTNPLLTNQVTDLIELK
ncbi:MAG: hypothetical protein K0S51_168 [Bacillales bacterium]|jgi:uncharacterized membrane protein required for colicin V production|nr:hypothetical protein [Bacillales bacterium]